MAPADALTSEVTPMCVVVPAGGAVVKDVLAPEVEVQPSGSPTTPVRVVDAKLALESMPPPSQERDRRRASCSERHSGCRAKESQGAETLTRMRPRRGDAPRLALCLRRLLVRVRRHNIAARFVSSKNFSLS